MPAGRPSFLTPEQRKENKHLLNKKWREESNTYSDYQRKYRLNSFKQKSKECLIKNKKYDKSISKKIDNCTTTKEVRNVIKNVLTIEEYKNLLK